MQSVISHLGEAAKACREEDFPETAKQLSEAYYQAEKILLKLIPKERHDLYMLTHNIKSNLVAWKTTWRINKEMPPPSYIISLMKDARKIKKEEIREVKKM